MTEEAEETHKDKFVLDEILSEVERRSSLGYFNFFVILLVSPCCTLPVVVILLLNNTSTYILVVMIVGIPALSLMNHSVASLILWS